MREGRYFPTSYAKRKTVGELLDRYRSEILPRKPKSAVQQARQLTWWRERLGYMTLADLTPEALGQARDALASGVLPNGKRRSASTVVRYLAVMSHALTVACKEWVG
jgi:hypothetical protein